MRFHFLLSPPDPIMGPFYPNHTGGTTMAKAKAGARTTRRKKAKKSTKVCVPVKFKEKKR